MANEKKKGRTSPNLKREGDNLINQFGVVFTSAEKRLLESEVQKAYRKRAKLLKQEGELDWLIGGVPTGHKVSQLQLMGRESDVVIAKRSKSLQRFKSREEFDRYMGSLKKTNSPRYIEEKMNDYRTHYVKKLKEQYGSSAEKLIKHILMMDGNKYMNAVMQSDEAQIRYLYEKGKNNAAPAIDTIARAFGLEGMTDESDETWDEEEFDF